MYLYYLELEDTRYPNYPTIISAGRRADTGPFLKPIL
jgi:hypothetical protein